MATESSFNSSPAIKIGPCGGSGGSDQDITPEPKRLLSITIRSDDVINSIGFSYLDLSGKTHTVGPWANANGQPQEIKLAADEYVREVSGTIRKFNQNQDTIIGALKIVTDLKTYGPYGDWEGVPFSLPVQPGSAIVGLFARSGWYLDAIGVYVRQI
ncbi:unnamed protein product [Urochloa humidicola]